MKHSLYYKFILGYLVFGFLGFIAIGTVSSSITRRYLIDEKADVLYDEANLIASSFSSVYQGLELDTAAAAPQLTAVASFIQSDIWIVDNQGTIVVDSDHSKRVDQTIPGFDPVSSGNRSYSIGNY